MDKSQLQGTDSVGEANVVVVLPVAQEAQEDHCFY